jgi:two-component system chemotaxis response regulator CheB
MPANPERHGGSVAVVLDDHALQIFPRLDGALAEAGALVMRSFKNTPNPQLLRRHAGVGVVGGPDKAGLMARLERAITTLASVPAPVIGVLPPGIASTPDLLGPGVVDIIPAGAQRVAERILLMAKVPVVTGGRGRAPARGAPTGRVGPMPVPPQRAAPIRPAARAPPEQLVAVASSTGGVWVLGAMLRDLPQAGRAVLVAQHMDAEFMSFFAQWLSDSSGWRVIVVEDREPLEAGNAYVPAGGRDLVVEGGRARALEARSRFVPSADRLLASAAAFADRAVGVVLSGMGSDGAAGLAEVMRAGGAGICQEPASAVVASMPESALRAAPRARPAAPEALAASVAGALAA